MSAMNLTSPPTAAARVLVIPELLQDILIQLVEPGNSIHAENEQIRMLFRLQRVNTKFRDTICRSKALQCAMYLESSNESNAGKSRPGRINPILGWLHRQAGALELTWFSRGTGCGFQNFYDAWYAEKFGPEPQALYLRCDINTGIECKDGDAVILEHMRELHAALSKGSWRSALVNNTFHSVKFELALFLHKIHGFETRSMSKELGPGSTLGEMVKWILNEVEKVCTDLEAANP